MVVRSVAEYVDFYIRLNMSYVSLLIFANNERMALKHRLEYKNQDVESDKKDTSTLEGLKKDISAIGERQVIERHVTKDGQGL